ncbi:putative Terminal beta-(1-_2)-arabinofuranosyltransferase [Streptomyces aurantiacus JA 4570]|uniref:Putative Terminal beta-(1->2)-arabinofuranosyltransferase n=1 Tax=Streptomyces aurantiacus JA 4570 TaxID=1286094 RepID=S4A0E4_9ACTN|nr:putative Terminal beta-(1->2)-arabinofuranosyltransferase [Streptomyces aurantiacus JA 4570]
MRSGGQLAAARPPLRAALCLAPALVILVAGFQRRWMSDDGHIYVRTVRQILAGHGPVFNAGERAESSTGTLWQWLLVLAGLPGADIASAAVYGGLLLTSAGFALAAWGAVRLHGGGGAQADGGAARPRDPRLLLPLGALVPIALPPVWDFATSGLETGLATCWIGGAWLLLVARPRSLATAFVLGLGPLVRPDLALVSAVFLGAQWLIARPSLRAALAGAAAAGALPVAYEIFRMGYYGHLMPLPGVTKEASQSLWGRGLHYLGDFAGPYLLWVPTLFVLAALLPAGRAGFARLAEFTGFAEPCGGSSGTPSVPLVPALAPVLAGALCWAYVIKVGGDFMHARMFLPGLLLLLLPVFLVPATRAWTAAVVGVGVWAVVCAAVLRIEYEGRIGPGGVADERGVYVRQNAAAHPVHHTFGGYRQNAAYAREVRAAGRAGASALFLSRTRLDAASPSVTGFYATLGLNGTAVPLDGAALDPIGLAYPLAAHSERLAHRRVGHDKWLPDAWIVADRGGGLPAGMDPARVAAARRALGCGPLAELRAATRAPLTPRRFLLNVSGAFERTSFRFPNDPLRAERQMCGSAGAP